ncbi:hypothetical protein [Aestuariirhabdus litorea]|nr:hypothetical protein [Aestuariirhabdus litorea]
MKTSAQGRRLLGLMLALLVFVGNCSAAMALPHAQNSESQIAITTTVALPDESHQGHCLQLKEASPDSGIEEQCWDNHCPNSLSASNTKLNKLTKFDDGDSPLYVAAINPAAKIGSSSCINQPLPASADFSPPPLFYTLCVLRL